MAVSLMESYKNTNNNNAFIFENNSKKIYKMVNFHLYDSRWNLMLNEQL